MTRGKNGTRYHAKSISVIKFEVDLIVEYIHRILTIVRPCLICIICPLPRDGGKFGSISARWFTTQINVLLLIHTLWLSAEAVEDARLQKIYPCTRQILKENLTREFEGFIIKTDEEKSLVFEIKTERLLILSSSTDIDQWHFWHQLEFQASKEYQNIPLPFYGLQSILWQDWERGREGEIKLRSKDKERRWKSSVPLGIHIWVWGEAGFYLWQSVLAYFTILFLINKSNYAALLVMRLTRNLATPLELNWSKLVIKRIR